MSITAVGISAYANAMADFKQAQARFNQASQNISGAVPVKANSFTETLNNSLGEVNNMQATKDKMVTSFAAGETQNVHELMITMQKAGLAVNLTSAVRNKVLEAYKELSRLQF